jgi:hypothetical protein
VPCPSSKGIPRTSPRAICRGGGPRDSMVRRALAYVIASSTSPCRRLPKEERSHANPRRWSTSIPVLEKDLYSAESVLKLHGMKTHVAFLHDEPLDDILAGRKKFEFRLSFGGLACRSAREGDRLLLKRSGGEVEARCHIGEVRFYRKLQPEEVTALAHRYADGVSAPYFQRYAAPNNPDRPVNVAIIELRDLRSATLPPEQTPRRVLSGWVANFDPGDEHTGKA